MVIDYGFNLSACRILRFTGVYGAYQVMTADVGECSTEKPEEFRDFSPRWKGVLMDKLGRPREYDVVQMFVSAQFRTDVSWTVWDFKGTTVRRVKEGVCKVGPYSNAYEKTFNGEKMFVVALGKVRQRHYSSTDLKTYTVGGKLKLKQ
jgi:hypothetical protein